MAGSVHFLPSWYLLTYTRFIFFAGDDTTTASSYGLLLENENDNEDRNRIF